MRMGALGRLPKPPRKPARGVMVAAPGAGPYSLDFTARSTEDPLSIGGTWTNNTQGTGGNVAANSQSSMRIIAAASGGINIAAGDATGQEGVTDYFDSFAFLPGYSGNQRITATMYVDAGYVPAANHELELLLGCSSSSGARRWISNTWNRDGARIMALMDGPPNGFTVLNPTDSGGFGETLADGDVWVAELHRASNTVITKKNGTQIHSLTDAAISALGDGVGIGSFRRVTGGGSAANRYGFKSVVIEAF